MLAIIINTKDTEFYGNYKTIALFTGLHEKSLPEIFERLIEKETLEIIEKRPGRTNRYRVLINIEDFPSLEPHNSSNWW